MLTDVLFIAVFFVTRIVLPLAVTYLVGIGIERALNHTPRAKTSPAGKLLERHAL